MSRSSRTRRLSSIKYGLFQAGAGGGVGAARFGRRGVLADEFDVRAPLALDVATLTPAATSADQACKARGVTVSGALGAASLFCASDVLVDRTRKGGGRAVPPEECDSTAAGAGHARLAPARGGFFADGAAPGGDWWRARWWGRAHSTC